MVFMIIPSFGCHAQSSRRCGGAEVPIKHYLIASAIFAGVWWASFLGAQVMGMPESARGIMAAAGLLASTIIGSVCLYRAMHRRYERPGIAAVVFGASALLGMIVGLPIGTLSGGRLGAIGSIAAVAGAAVAQFTTVFGISMVFGAIARMLLGAGTLRKV
jgi:hypothetical protein